MPKFSVARYHLRSVVYQKPGSKTLRWPPYRAVASRVRLHMPSGPATGASLSVLARVLRLCDGLGIALTLTDRPWAPHTPPAHADRPAAAGS
ncbi:hypothetical protein [Streptomyces sp. NPDC047141]|uniref:hypothetical protein n=1 Tax=Streptomyces sp. NPDC047141 TaxID=3155738 RepID=UPI0033E560E4